jgi:hypothetical protein
MLRAKTVVGYLGVSQALSGVNLAQNPLESRRRTTESAVPSFYESTYIPATSAKLPMTISSRAGRACEWRVACNSQPEMIERRTEPRIDFNAPVVLIPLAAVGVRVSGFIVNASGRGLKVRLTAPAATSLRAGHVYRIQCNGDTLLCEVAHSVLHEHGAEVGFRVIHRASTGEAKSYTKLPRPSPGSDGPVVMKTPWRT